jgi:hypothetical protein
MKPNALRLSASALVLAAVAGHSSADTWTDRLLTPSATDLYEVTCTNSAFGTPTGHLTASVRDEKPPKRPANQIVLQILQVVSGVKAAASTTDPRDGNKAFGPEAEVAGGNGIYYVTVTKTGVGPEKYTLSMHCESANGLEHTGTSFQILQDDN